MTTIQDRSPTAEPPPALAAALAETEDAARFVRNARRRLLAIGCFIAATATVAAPIVAPWEGDGEWIATLAENPGRGQAGALMYWLAFLFGICPTLCLIAMVRRRAVKLGIVGTVLAVLGGVAGPGLLITDFFQLGMGETLPLEQALAVEKQMEQYVALLPLYMLPFFAGTLGGALLLIAAWRAGWLHPAVPAIWAAGFGFLFFAPSSTLPSILGWSVAAIPALLVGIRVLRATDEEWRTGLALPRDSR